MRTPLLRLAALALLVGPTIAQFESARHLIPKEQSNPVPGIPFDGIWTRQFFIGEGNAYLRPVDGGWLSQVKHARIHWDESSRSYVGMIGGRGGRVLPLGKNRCLFERDLQASNSTWVTIVEWNGPAMHIFKFDTGADSDFAKHLLSKGVRVNKGVVDGNRDAIIAALRTLPLGKRELDERLRRPSHEEMGFIWNYFEMQRWFDQHDGFLNKIESNIGRMQALGPLHLAHKLASDSIYPDMTRLDVLSFGPYRFGELSEDRVQYLHDRATSLVERIEKRLEKRMEWLAGQIEILEHVEEEFAEDASNQWVFRPHPGHLLEFHIVVTSADGTVLEDTHKTGTPMIRPVMGDLPEGIQYGLRTMGFEERITLRVPAGLAFGPEHGDVDIQLEIVRGLASEQKRPPIEGIMRAEIATISDEETASGLRYRQLAAGQGATPQRGQQVEIRTRSWNALGRALGESEVIVAEFGSPNLLAGVNETLASMQVGGQRVLFVPRHRAAQAPSRAGMAQCIVVELLSIVD